MMFCIGTTLKYQVQSCKLNLFVYREVIEDLRKYAALPDTIVAVVGNTGAGKSSLLNALLDHFDILPTSGMQACTAAVVEINNNTENDRYSADVEFLTAKVSHHLFNLRLSGIQLENLVIILQTFSP